MERLGLKQVDSTLLPEPPTDLTVGGPPLEHLCFGDDEEFFPFGVPVFRSASVDRGSLCGIHWRVSLPDVCKPYWSGPILLLHQWASPDWCLWRPINGLEAMGLLTMEPGLGAVRYKRPCGDWAELFLRDGHIYADYGDTPSGHHAAYTPISAPGTDRILERPS